MPELPEVETSRRGIAPHVEGRRLKNLLVRDRRLRWPVEDGLENVLQGQRLNRVGRRAKYLLLEFETNTLLLHLGMSGSVRIVSPRSPAATHDHIDFVFSRNILRFRDPRRFGSLHLAHDGVEQHFLIAHLGPEPLRKEFHAEYIFSRSRGRKQAVKNFIMDNKIVVGVGNIYANEALFRAGIAPHRAAGKISLSRYTQLVQEIKLVLNEAIAAGGTTLRDFVGGEGESGYFAIKLQVYGREGQPCNQCGRELSGKRLGQRASVYCKNCQR